jgi:site-specific DNA-methyltransferase (adenine-specific)
MSGGEPSLATKRLAKKAAWANGDAPKKTVHTIYQGDAREMREVSGPVHLVVTSPPYFNLIDYEGAETVPGQLGSIDAYEAFLDELDRVWQRSFDLLTPGGRLCVVVGSVCVSRREAGRHYVLPLPADISVRARRIGFDYLTPIHWYKIANMATEVGGSARFLGKPYEPNAVLKNDIETILLLRKPGSYRKPTPEQRALSLIEPDDFQRWFRSVWTDVRGENRRRGHPAPYPVEIASRLIQMFSFVGDAVLDPFWGTGTTTVAAMNVARNSIGYDIDRRFLEMGRERLEQMDAVRVPARIAFAG